MILIIGPGGCGFTFLAWTISFLRGDVTYTKLDGEITPVVDNPIVRTVAHLYKKDHICISGELPRLHLATEQSIVYLVPTHQHDLEYALGLSSKKIVFQNTPNYAHELFARLCLTIVDTGAMRLINQLSFHHDIDSIKQVMLEYNHIFTNYFQMPIDYQDYFSVTYPDIYHNLDSRIYDIFDYLKYTIDSSRIEHWHKVYSHYKSINQNFLERFCPHTVEVDPKTKLKIIKEIIKWINGSSLQKC